ncbi:hypothetical protein SDRG_05827 [Saprolegnia diclina VS20]|uniref:Uncharacterized protein n=1 Tax=Saprolegnia diclina (strain VS20) TaxID=1156394 RepID=T0QSP6_SAPDV|nr:hypothetical protein SDRG_05827 [Saprolegnia diclina VS20]EQC37010.1 hypothetical protein SDRG_05827 [Saprolegnia diclina VS20]|eukprot:XP_008609791.1 hypothetical protein SDRG_05827 [Saprolegnia diclina VS20]
MAVEAEAVLEPVAPEPAGSSALAAVAAIGTVLEPASPEPAVPASPAASGAGSSALGAVAPVDINPGTKGANATGTCVRDALIATFHQLKGRHDRTITPKLIDDFLVKHEKLEPGKGSLLKDRVRDDKQNDIITTCETPGAYHFVTFEDPGFHQHLMAVRVREENNGKFNRSFYEDGKWKALSTLRFIRSTSIRSICRVQLKDSATTTQRAKPIEPNATDHKRQEVIDLTSDNDDCEPKKRRRFTII